MSKMKAQPEVQYRGEPKAKREKQELQEKYIITLATTALPHVKYRISKEFEDCGELGVIPSTTNLKTSPNLNQINPSHPTC